MKSRMSHVTILILTAVGPRPYQPSSMETTAHTPAMDEDEAIFIHYPKASVRVIKDTIYDQSK